MNITAQQSPNVLASVDFAELKRDATAERAEAVRNIGHVIAAWLRSGLKLRFSDDAITHPAAGKLCGC